METKGFYLAGDFSTGRKASFILLPKKEKPFKVDNLRGIVEAKGIPIMEKNRHYMFPDEWHFIEGANLSEFTDKKCNETPVWANQIIEEINEKWRQWCQEYKRKYAPLYGEIKTSQ